IVSMPTPRRRFLGLYEWLIDLVIWRAASKVVVNARCIEEALIAMRGLPRGLCAVIHNGLEDGPVKADPVNNESVVIGCVARLETMKGTLILLDAFTKLATHHPRIHLVLAGDGEASTLVARRVGEYDLQNRVRLLGHYSGNVATLLSTFDIFAFPSLWEGLPYSILEAMRSQLPIVATRVGGIPECISDGIEGLLVEPNDKESLVTALEKLLNDPPLRRKLATQARDRFTREFELKAMYQQARSVLLEATKA
ncbi:MAG: glycosyltransferase family 4 protein, partial [Bdellovibrionota bacterium]